MLEIINSGPKWIMLCCKLMFYTVLVQLSPYIVFIIGFTVLLTFTTDAWAGHVIYAAVHRRKYCDFFCKDIKHHFKSSKGALLPEC